MVGNDVVDLRDRDTDPSTLSARFDERVFSDRERDLLAASGTPVVLRWTLWAAKEAAYKLVVKRDPDVIFSPSRFEVSLSESGRAGGHAGVVEAANHVVPVQIREADGAIHAVATTSATPLVVGLERREAGLEVPADGSAPGRAVRGLALARIAEHLTLDPARLEIRKKGRVPELFIDGVRASADLSLAHHGDVIGFAFEPSEMKTRSRAEAPVREAAVAGGSGS